VYAAAIVTFALCGFANFSSIATEEFPAERARKLV
jgi:nucleoside permease NupC